VYLWLQLGKVSQQPLDVGLRVGQCPGAQRLTRTHVCEVWTYFANCGRAANRVTGGATARFEELSAGRLCDLGRRTGALQRCPLIELRWFTRHDVKQHARVRHATVLRAGAQEYARPRRL